MIETALVELAKAGGTELFLSLGESLLKKVKTSNVKHMLHPTELIPLGWY